MGDESSSDIIYWKLNRSPAGNEILSMNKFGVGYSIQDGKNLVYNVDLGNLTDDQRKVLEKDLRFRLSPLEAQKLQTAERGVREHA